MKIMTRKSVLSTILLVFLISGYAFTIRKTEMHHDAELAAAIYNQINACNLQPSTSLDAIVGRYDFDQNRHEQFNEIFQDNITSSDDFLATANDSEITEFCRKISSFVEENV